MKMILIFVFMFLFTACCKSEPVNHDDELFFNVKGRIIQKLDFVHLGIRDPDFYILIQKSPENHYFCIWRTKKEQFFNYKVGQKVHFDYIRKDAWFYITNYDYLK